MSNYKFGASFNCSLPNDDIGGGGEGCTSVDFVSNDLVAIKAAMLDDGRDPTQYHFDDDHKFIGQDVDVGGVVIAVMVTNEEDKEDECVTAVLFTEPSTPTIVEVI